MLDLMFFKVFFQPRDMYDGPLSDKRRGLCFTLILSTPVFSIAISRVFFTSPADILGKSFQANL